MDAPARTGPGDATLIPAVLVPRRGRRRDLAGALAKAGLSGILLALSFPRYGHPILAWVALAPVIVAVFDSDLGRPPFRRSRTFLLGFVSRPGIFRRHRVLDRHCRHAVRRTAGPCRRRRGRVPRRVSVAVPRIVHARARVAWRQFTAVVRSCSHQPSG